MLQAKELQGLVLLWAVVLVQVWGGDLAEGQLPDPVQATGGEVVVLDPNRVLAQVGDNKLLVWQAEILIKNGLGGDLSSTANEWIRVTLRDLEARRRGVHKSREMEFQMDFREKYNLGIFLFEEHIMATVPEVSEEEARARYEQDIDRYIKPMVVDIQHIQVPQKDVADRIAAEARKPEVSFDSLVEQWARGNDKATKGYMYGATYDFLKETLGLRAADEIRMNNGPGLVGSVMGQNGYEVIKIHQYNPGLNYTFEQIKENIRSNMKAENYQQLLIDLDEKMEKEINVIRSDEVKKPERIKKEKR